MKYRVLITRSKACPYAVYGWVEQGRFWQQVSRDYFYCKCAYNYLKKLEKR